LYGQYVPFVVVVEGINTFVVVATCFGAYVVVSKSIDRVVVVGTGVCVVGREIMMHPISTT
jgi:hypothetical protein